MDENIISEEDMKKLQELFSKVHNNRTRLDLIGMINTDGITSDQLCEINFNYEITQIKYKKSLQEYSNFKKEIYDKVGISEINDK